jgi:hypothetical protein
VLDWAAPADRPLAGLKFPDLKLADLKLADLDPFLLALGLALALAAWRTQRSWLRGLLGEWRVARLLRRHRIEARHDVLLQRPDGTGWTQIDHLVRLPDRILVVETKNFGGRRPAGLRTGRLTRPVATKAGRFDLTGTGGNARPRRPRRRAGTRA